MDMTLEDILREATTKGLTHFSLWPTQSQDGKKVYWTARATPSTMHSYVQVQDTDPVKAVLAVLANLPKAAKRAAKKIAVTDTVTEPEQCLVNDPTATEPETLDTWLPKT